MTESERFEVTRRAVLRGAAVGSVVLLGTLVPAHAASAASGSDHQAGAAELAKLDRITDIEGVRAEYRLAVQHFPFALPSGWSFPPESTRQDTEPGHLWERGNGEAEAYLFWQRAMAFAALDAHQRGNDTEAQRLLDLLEAGYGSPARRAVIEDPGGAFIGTAIAPARSAVGRRAAGGNDFALLMQLVGA